MDRLSRLKYLEAMGIQVWLPVASNRLFSDRTAGEVENEQESTQPVVPIEPSGDAAVAASDRSENPETASEEMWDALQKKVAACTACPLHRSRTQTVFGTGNRSAEWMVIGEAPGAQEDRQGEPFVGPAGLLLNEMLRAVGLRREDVFIANILKCRPPQNRDPLPAEVEACSAFLEQQVALVKPKIILAVGRVAAQNLLKVDAPLGRLRGKVHRYAGIPVVVVYHPAYLLRQLREKAKAWQDLQLASKVFNGQA
jgi:uracil-DNA glycosylase